MNKILDYVPLASRVIAVAVERHDKPEAWTAYIDAVNGYKHSEEVAGVAQTGDKLPEGVARILFPQFSGPYISR